MLREAEKAVYKLMPGIKADPERFWKLPDRVFFGNGACHILAGVFLTRPPLPGYYAEWIVPGDGFSGNHIYVTNGRIAFDYHGYSLRANLLRHHTSGWSNRYSGGWSCAVKRVSFDLLDTHALNSRNMRGPDRYKYDPVQRAQKFLERFCHGEAAAKVISLSQRAYI
jgi:hypothetical protein